MTGFGSFDNSTCKRVLDLLEPGDLKLGQVPDESTPRTVSQSVQLLLLGLLLCQEDRQTDRQTQITEHETFVAIVYHARCTYSCARRRRTGEGGRYECLLFTVLRSHCSKRSRGTDRTYVLLSVVEEIFPAEHEPELVPLAAQQLKTAVFLFHQQPTPAVAAAEVFA